jgi:enamine deaminase RidA (YjgF/YER057c/UK114 family)
MFAKADERLAALGSHRGALAFCAVLLRDIGDVAAFNAEWDAWVAPVSPPARACFQAQLANPDMRVEMIVVCAAAA